jgi:transcriptional antiterminator Rof (Rho-off)
MNSKNEALAYKAVDCHFYDEFEAASVKKINCVIIYESEGKQITVKDKVIDLKIINKAEYMILEKNEKIRLDKILSFNSKHPSDKPYC